jgi:hypothetical protein
VCWLQKIRQILEFGRHQEPAACRRCTATCGATWWLAHNRVSSLVAATPCHAYQALKAKCTVLHLHPDPPDPRPPNTTTHRQLTRVYSRAYLCDRLTSNSTCSAQSGALGCYWDDGGKKCRSREMSDWSWFSRHTYLVRRLWLHLCLHHVKRMYIALRSS